MMISAANSTFGSVPKRIDDRIVIHFDYDCFYASVVEAEDPSLKAIPLAVQQKHIIVTCNYVARRRGLFKLQSIADAKRICPEVVIVLGEDLTRFRDASKALYQFLRGYSWNEKVERLGFDEVFMDVTDMIDYNMEILNINHLQNSFFHLSKSDPTVGFSFDASVVAGNSYPPDTTILPSDQLTMRLVLGSHLAQHLRLALESQKLFTSSVGISTNKVLSKLVGNVHKPQAQTTLLPPYSPSLDDPETPTNITTFLSTHEVGAIPWIGTKLAYSLRALVPADQTFTPFEPNANQRFQAQAYAHAQTPTPVSTLLALPHLSPAYLTTHLRGPGIPSNTGLRVFNLLHGIDPTPVAAASDIPRQISIEDSYIQLNTAPALATALTRLSSSLIRRLRIDLRGPDGAWLARGHTLRLTTRPRRPRDVPGPRAWKRISRSAPCPAWLYTLPDGVADNPQIEAEDTHEGEGEGEGEGKIEALAARLVAAELMPLFRRLQQAEGGAGGGWDLSLINVAVVDIRAVAAEGGDVGAWLGSVGTMGGGKRSGSADAKADSSMDIDARAEEEEDDVDMTIDEHTTEDIDIKPGNKARADEQDTWLSDDEADDSKFWDDEFDSNDGGDGHASRERPDMYETNDGDGDDAYEAQARYCGACGTAVPGFAWLAHQRFHALPSSQ